MFARTFKVLLFGAERLFARGGVPAGVLLPNQARYQLRYIPRYEWLRACFFDGEI